MTTNTPRIEVTVAAPVEVVWDALRNKEKIRHWHGWEYDGLDSEIDTIYFTETSADESTRTLDVSGGDRFTIEPAGTGSRVILTRAAPSGDPEWDAYYDDVTEGWITFLQQLRFLLERQPDAERRTLCFSGVADRTGPVADELGIGRCTDEPAGTPVVADLVDEPVKGEVWFASEHQLGITVDAWGGDGLLIVSYLPPSPAKPKGAAMAVLSTYGLDDARLTDLDARWRHWWEHRYPGE